MNNKTFFWKIISAISLSAAVFLIYQIAGAWTNPTQNPPNGGGGNMTFSGANVGIGTTNPGSVLEVAGQITTKMVSPAVNIRSSADTAGLYQYLIFGTPTYNRALFRSQSLNTKQGLLNLYVFDDAGSQPTVQTWNSDKSVLFYGNVGIGTTNPAGLLTVSGDATAVNARVKGSYETYKTATSEVGDWVFGAGGAMGSSLANDFTFYDGLAGGAGVAMTIKQQTGNVGIGTTNPTSKLHILSVAGSIAPGIALMQADAPTYGYTWRRDDSTGNLIAARVEAGVSSDYMTIARNSGNVGIGTTNPTGQLTTEGNNATASSLILRDNKAYNASPSAYQEFVTKYTSAGAYRAMAYIQGGKENTVDADTKGFLAFHTSTIEQMRINGSGNVGIGTTNPNQRLEVKAVADATDAIRISHSSQPTNFYMDLGETFLTMYRNGSGADLAISSTGSYSAGHGNILLQPYANVGIGTAAPTQKLEVNGGISLTSNVASPPNPYSGSIADWYTGNARFYSYGADAATRGGFTFTSVESDGGNALSVMTINSNGVVSVPGRLSGSGPQIVAAKAWCAAVAIQASRSYGIVIDAPGETACSTLCTNAGHTGCAGSVDFNHGCDFSTPNCTMYTGAAGGTTCTNTYNSRDYCCCYL